MRCFRVRRREEAAQAADFRRRCKRDRWRVPLGVEQLNCRFDLLDRGVEFSIGLNVERLHARNSRGYALAFIRPMVRLVAFHE